MQPDDVDRELDRLWAKVAAAAGESPAPLPAFALESSSPTHGWGLETIAFLKKQHNEQARQWAEMLETKERALAALRDRERMIGAEIKTLREQLRVSEARVTVEMLDTKAKLEAGYQSLEQERAENERERQALDALLAATRERLANENARFKALEREWEKREQDYLINVRELQATIKRYQEETSLAEEGSHRLSDNIKEAKSALEKTLAELLLERKTREDAEKERAAALKKVDEVEKHFNELEKIWQEERAQWRELWDRERSTWETQRAEFSTWEEKLRKEREAWQEELKGQEKNQLKFVAQVNENLRDSAETTTKMASALKSFEQIKAVALEAASVEAEARFSRFRKALGFWPRALAAAAMLALAFPTWRYATTPHFKKISSVPIVLDNPTAMAYDGASLWVSDWKGTLSAFDPAKTDAPVRQTLVSGLGAYHPVALAFGGEHLWTLDAAQARVLRHKAIDPALVEQTRASPGPAPTALAFDGQSLWSYDAANKIAYQHGSDESNIRAFGIAEDVVPTAMAWERGRLWLFDSKARQIVIYRLKNGALLLSSRHPVGEQILGMVASDGRLWALAGPAADRPGFALLTYKY